MYNGKNNGAIFLSVRDATARLGFVDFRPAMAAFEELQLLKLIRLEAAGSFNMKVGGVSKAPAWHLNIVDAHGQPASEESLPEVDLNALPQAMQRRMARRQAVLKRYLKDYQDGKFPVVDSTTLDARRVGEITTATGPTVGEDTTPPSENGGNACPATVGESTTHILHHIPGADPVALIRNQVSDWWRISDAKARLRLAKQHKLEIGELLDFVQGGTLPFPKLVAIRASIGPNKQTMVA
jgi:hypothetical protein